MIKFILQNDYSAVIRGKKKELTLLTGHWVMHGTPGSAEEPGLRYFEE